MPKLVVIVGPTAVGKTSLSLALAREFDGEIVNADATALYVHLNIGSAKPTPQEREQVPHHLLDVALPDRVITVAEYQHLAYTAIDDILARGKTPFLVGGSGLYIQAVVRGYQFPHVPPNPPLREALEKEAQVKGNEWLHAQLAAVDPVAAAKTHPNNVGRVIRALEVHNATGAPISEFWRSRQVRYDPILIGINRDRESLYQRIDLRVERMLAGGLVREVEQILAEGYSADSPALAAIGYKEVVPYLQGRVDLDTVAVEIKRATRRFVRQQLNTWFRPDDVRITWFDADAPDTGDRIRQLLESHE